MPMSEVDLVRAACCIAGLDRDVCDKERPLLEKLARAAGVGQASLEAMIERARTDQNFYQDQFRVLKPEADRAIRVLTQVAMANGELSLAERVILQHFGERLGVDQERIDRLLTKAERELERQRNNPFKAEQDA